VSGGVIAAAHEKRRWMQLGPTFGTRGPTFQCEGRRRKLGRPRRAREHAALLEVVDRGAALEARVETVGDRVKLLQGVLDGVFDVEELLAVVGVPVLLVVARPWCGGCEGMRTCALAAGGMDAVRDLLRHLTELRNATRWARDGGPQPT
jgi:hypothetical protein